MWPQGVVDGFKGPQVALGVADSILGLQLASRDSGGLMGSFVAMESCGWYLGVAVDLKGLRVTQIRCQIFKNVQNFRIEP
jgi:hypothetical protein